ncbi:MAG: hypothetical protein IPK82_02445 [Polyangiaceae bacterium]|nr:hypothetical protein [Polyangiaceae bacterium]
MTAGLQFSLCSLAIAGALAIGNTGCARAVTYEPTGGSGGESSTATSGGGGMGGSTMSTTTTHEGPCVYAEDCAQFNTACTVGTCINGECTTSPANELGACDDGQYCTINDTCQNGICKGGPQLNCSNSSDPCQVGVCDEITDSCVTQPGNNGAQCDDGDPCTGTGKCLNGQCDKGPPMNCTLFDTMCTVGVCDPVGGCKAVPKNDGIACDDGLYCTANDTCQNGTCVGGGALPCAPPGGCFVGMCDELFNTCTAVPGNDGAACDDGSPCTESTTCAAGVCANGTPANDGAACDDGTSCTMGETCAAGLCTGGAGPTIYFADDFKDNSKGWTLGTEWAIGPAMMSIGGTGNPDPATDHTPTADNGVAGVVIGGTAATVVHPYYWLESPAFDTSAAAGPVILGFYRWLNSDYDPFMHNAVEVFNGNQWINLWTTGGPPGVMDAEWTFQEFDLTTYKNPSMRIRFGFDIGSTGVYTIGSWNIDDVLVASGACP